MEAAYAGFDYKAAKSRLESVAKRIEYKYPSAAESIREGLELKVIPVLINALQGKDILTSFMVS